MGGKRTDTMDGLLEEIRACTLCHEALKHGVRPILQVHSQAKILIAGQAPGRKVHETGIPFDDPSGERLRDWMGISKEVFYDASKIAIVPMGFCYPGTGKSGDLPPRPECAPAWNTRVMDGLQGLRLKLVIGQYAMDHYLGRARRNLTETVRDRGSLPKGILPLPHPSPRNNRWLKRNPWFEAEVLPELKEMVRKALT
ncbi:MAG: uracil-DNA glycosylase family protein [Planctomycetota bacterium]